MPKPKQTGLIYTMNMDTPELYDGHIQMNERMISMIFGAAESLVSCDTFHHVKDYSMSVAEAMEAVAERKQKHREEVFPNDCEKAFAISDRLAMPA